MIEPENVDAGEAARRLAIKTDTFTRLVLTLSYKTSANAINRCHKTTSTMNQPTTFFIALALMASVTGCFDSVYAQELASAQKAARSHRTQNPHQAWLEGRKLAHQGRFGEAIPLLRLAAMSNSADPLAERYRDLGAAYLLNGQADEAVNWLNYAQDIMPSDMAIMQLRATAYANLGKLRKASKILKKCAETSPKNDTIWVNLGSLYEKRERYDEAEEAYTNAQSINPDNLKALTGRATLMARRSHYQDALPIFEDLARKLPEDKAVQLNRALALYNTESLTAAAEGFTRVVKLDKGNTQALTLRGVCYYRLRNQFAACRDWTKAASLGDKDAIKALKEHCEKTTLPLGDVK